jgi:UDP:flavonoid glycosyltransferase YjiC (YdhE family)
MVLPFPAQGHVTPLMELSHRLVDNGFEVTFVNTEVTTRSCWPCCRRR